MSTGPRQRHVSSPGSAGRGLRSRCPGVGSSWGRDGGSAPRPSGFCSLALLGVLSSESHHFGLCCRVGIHVPLCMSVSKFPLFMRTPATRNQGHRTPGTFILTDDTRKDPVSKAGQTSDPALPAPPVLLSGGQDATWPEEEGEPGARATQSWPRHTAGQGRGARPPVPSAERMRFREVPPCRLVGSWGDSMAGPPEGGLATWGGAGGSRSPPHTHTPGLFRGGLEGLYPLTALRFQLQVFWGPPALPLFCWTDAHPQGPRQRRVWPSPRTCHTPAALAPQPSQPRGLYHHPYSVVIKLGPGNNAGRCSLPPPLDQGGTKTGPWLAPRLLRGSRGVPSFPDTAAWPSVTGGTLPGAGSGTGGPGITPAHQPRRTPGKLETAERGSAEGAWGPPGRSWGAGVRSRDVGVPHPGARPGAAREAPA